MPPITRGLSRARKKRIGVALCRAARCRRVALRQRRKAAVDVVASAAVGLQANREIWIVSLSPRRRGCRNHSYYQNRKRQSTHPGRAFFRASEGRDLARTSFIPTRRTARAEQFYSSSSSSSSSSSTPSSSTIALSIASIACRISMKSRAIPSGAPPSARSLALVWSKLTKRPRAFLSASS
jgi:hypothetical protein